MAINARLLRQRARANEQGFNVRAAAPAMKKIIYDRVLEQAAWLQSLEVNVRPFRSRFVSVTRILKNVDFKVQDLV